MTRSPRSKRNALPATSPAPSWSAKAKYTKEMAKMSITRKHLAKAARQFDLTCQLSQPAQTEVTHVTLTTPLKASDVAIYTNTNTSVPHNMHSSITGAQITQPDRWPEAKTNMIEINEHAAFNSPISTLVDLWVTRFGNEWVDLETVEEDEFFLIAYKRLRQMAQIEVHYLTDRARYVCRKPE